MKRLSGKKKIMQTVFCLFLLFIAPITEGCGKTDSSQLEEDMSGVSDDIGTGTDADAGSPGEIPERITYEITTNSSGSYINVDAEVIVPEVASYSVYEEKRVGVDDAFLKALAGNLFDDGAYEQIKPAWMCTRDELVSVQAYTETLLERYAGEDDVLLYRPDWVYNLYHVYNEVSYDGSMAADLTEGRLIYRYTGYYDTDGNTVDGGYDSCMLRGTVDGEEWLLYYESEGASESEDTEPDINSKSKLVLAPANSKYHGWILDLSSQGNDLDTTMYGENVSDEALCRQTVYDFAERLGLSDNMEIACVYGLVVTDEAGNSRLDGYRMYMVPAINGAQNYFSNMSCLGTGDWDLNHMFAYQEYVVFDVSSEGVCSVFVGNQYEMGECMTQEANMLTFEQVDMIAQEYMQQLVNTPPDEQTHSEKIDRVQLSYATVQYENGYSFVPVWMYYLEYDIKYMFHEAFFGINALDGSILPIVDGGSYGYMFY